MEISGYFSIWNKLKSSEQNSIKASSFEKTFLKGSVIHRSSEDCTGVILVKSGQLRAYIMSEEGKEVTIYRLFKGDICLFSATCIMRQIQFDITIEAEKDTEVTIVSPDVYLKIMEESAPLSNFTNEILQNRLSNAMWLIEQIMFRSFDKRLAGFLVKESEIEGENTLKITHEDIAKHLGTAREVVTRMLKYFQEEGLVELKRGTIEITDFAELEDLSEE